VTSTGIAIEVGQEKYGDDSSTLKSCIAPIHVVDEKNQSRSCEI